jgi:biopolymer transport protein ExbB
MTFWDSYWQVGWLVLPLSLICLLIWLTLLLPFDEQQDLEHEWLQRKAWLKALTAAAPLLGLLGTVLGLMQTFRELASGQQQAELSTGISQALLSTQLGLIVSLPGFLGLSWLKRRVKKRQLLAHQLSQGVHP